MENVLPLILFIGIFAFMYMLVVRPQRRRALQMQEMQRALKPGDEVITAGGVYASVHEIEDGGTVLLEVSEDVLVRFQAAAIAQVVKNDEELPTTDVSSPSTPE